ncbi:MAG: acyl-CoA/acyl-ACP dehydrogenase [Myxococcota bacterium]|jgi:alkylation response protein AidB-like acyl-CoA dehydrogenase|nr:acyl-CoA/acyl-ACP dehydrogenase [Myxococcota bacterium]
MIDFELGDELELVRKTARDYADDHLRPGMRENESARSLGAKAWELFGEIGFACLEWPERGEAGGLGALAHSLVLEELAAADPGAALALEPLGAALYPLLEFGGEEAVLRYGEPLLTSPGARSVLVWVGAGGRASLADQGKRVSGSVPWIPADRVDSLILLDETRARVVRGGLEFRRVRGSGLRAAGASEVIFEGAEVVAEWEGEDEARRALARARLHTASLMLGVMREACDYSRNYALDRVAFGRPIAHHQALAFLIADMATALESARLLAWEAAWRLDTGLRADEACATAFLEAAEQTAFIGPNGVQILGGHGFMQDHPVEKFMREGRSLSLLLGGVDTARECAMRELAGTAGDVLLPLGDLS